MMLGGVSIALIDGKFLQSMCNSLGIELDYSKFLEGLDDNYNILRPYFYKAVEAPDPEDNYYQHFRRLQDYLLYNGYETIVHQVNNKKENRYLDTSSIEMKLACDLVYYASNLRNLNRIVLVASNRNYAEAVNLVKDLGVEVTVLGNHNHEGDRTHARLRKAADNFDELMNVIIDAKAAKGSQITKEAVRQTNWEEDESGPNNWFELYVDDNDEPVHESTDANEIVNAALQYGDDPAEHKFTIIDGEDTKYYSIRDFKVVYGLEDIEEKDGKDGEDEASNAA